MSLIYREKLVTDGDRILIPDNVPAHLIKLTETEDGPCVKWLENDISLVTTGAGPQ